MHTTTTKPVTTNRCSHIPENTKNELVDLTGCQDVYGPWRYIQTNCFACGSVWYTDLDYDSDNMEIYVRIFRVSEKIIGQPHEWTPYKQFENLPTSLIEIIQKGEISFKL
jgi:hypothetical protein